MPTFNYNPLTFKSLGFGNELSLLQGIGGNYGYSGDVQAGPTYQNDIQRYLGQGKYIIDNHIFNSRNDYNNLNNYISGRASFLDQQARDNPIAYSEFIKNPYAFTGTSPLKTASQRAAELEAAKQKAQQNASGGTAKNAGTTSIIGGKTSTTTPIKNVVGPAVPLPANIPPNNNALLRELRVLLGNIPGLFDTKGITRAFNDRIVQDEAFGRSSADSAAAIFAANARAEGGDPGLAGIVRAQALLPVLQHSSSVRSELADKQLQARQAQGNLTATVAEALGNLRTNYLKGLVDYTGRLQDIQSQNQINTSRLDEQRREFDIGNQLDLSKLKLQERAQTNDDKRDRLQALLAIAQLNRQKVDPRLQNYHPRGLEPTPTDPYRQEYNDDLESIMAQLQGLY